MRRFEVNRFCWARLGNSMGEADGLWGKILSVFDLRRCSENRDVWLELRHGFIRWEEGGCCQKMTVADVCMKPLVSTGIAEDMVFQRFIAEQGADSLERYRARSGDSPCGCDGCTQRIVTSGPGADEHEVEQVDVAV